MLSNYLKYVIRALLILQLLILYGCGSDPENWEVEYDEFIPGFHGESVSFNKPMVYVLVNTPETGPTPFQMRIGKKLTAKRTIRAYKWNIELIELDNDEIFEVVGSLWVRKDWWSRIFTSDWRFVIFIDSKGVKSYSMMNIFKLYSNRPEFDTYTNQGQ